MKLNSLIIAAGNIGSVYDDQNDSHILSHAKAYTNNYNFNLVGFVDVDIFRAKTASKKWNSEYFNSIDDALNKYRIDVYSVCVPDHLHYEVLKTLCKLKNIFIFTEKPLTRYLFESKEIINLMKKNNISCSVNYKREFLPEFSKFFKNSKKNVFGKLNFGLCYYSKGLNHNASHALSILNNLDPIKSIKILNSFEKIKELKSDSSQSFLMEVNNGYNFLFKAFQDDKYPIFELDFHFEKARIRIKELGDQIEYSFIRENKIFKDHRFVAIEELVNTNLSKSLEFSLNNIYNYITKNDQLISPVTKAFEVMQIVDLIKLKLKLKDNEK